MEFTPNFNGNAGGFLVDPNAAQDGGNFGVGIGRGDSRNNAYFTRPSAGQWHHYALVLDTTAPAATQITPYVDGQPVSYEKADSGTGRRQLRQLDALLHVARRRLLFGAGDLDEVAIYNRALSAATIAEHYSSSGTNRRPNAAFTDLAEPGPARPDGHLQRLRLERPGRHDRQVRVGPRRQRQLRDRHGPAADRQPQLRRGDLADREAARHRQPQRHRHRDARPRRSPTRRPPRASPPRRTRRRSGSRSTFNGSASSDPDGTIAKYEWDLDGNGSFETDTGTTRHHVARYSAAGSVPVGLRVTDNDGLTATKTVSVIGPDRRRRLRGHGPRRPPASSPTGASAKPPGTRSPTARAPTPRRSRAARPSARRAASPATRTRRCSFDGVNDAARRHGQPVRHERRDGRVLAQVGRLRRRRPARDGADRRTSTTNNGGFLDRPERARTARSASAIGNDGGRNNAYFARPSAGQWHHYAFVLDTQRAGGRPGRALRRRRAGGLHQGRERHRRRQLRQRAAALHVALRASALFGGGDLDEVAIYDRALSAATIAAHRAAGAP